MKNIAVQKVKVGRGSILQRKSFGNEVAFLMLDIPNELPNICSSQMSVWKPQGSRFLKTISNRRQID